MTATPLVSPRPLTAETPARLSAWAILKRKAIGLAMRCFKTWSSLSYQLMSPRTKRLHGIDHVTEPCRDLAVAEEFYVGLMGARVMARFDAARLRSFGRPDAEIPQAVHLSLVFAGGPRLDLFQSDVGQPPPSSGHTHVAFFIAPGTMLGWKKRLNDAGVPTYGPVQLGPAGQASLYFNDPSGNHLELVTYGFGHAIPVSPPDTSTLGYTWRGRKDAPSPSTRAA
jgi:catechol 2,3-dioxygenase-like lactoylglutathione lyase family enzyme